VNQPDRTKHTNFITTSQHHNYIEATHLETNRDGRLASGDLNASEVAGRLSRAGVVEVHQARGGVQLVALLVEGDVAVGADAAQEKPDACVKWEGVKVRGGVRDGNGYWR